MSEVADDGRTETGGMASVGQKWRGSTESEWDENGDDDGSDDGATLLEAAA